MLLAIDIGNTNTVFAVYKKDKLLNSWRCQSAAARTADEYAAFLHEMFSIQKITWKDIADIIISSVVPDADFNIRKFCKKYVGKDPVFITSKITGVEVLLDRPEEVGADRLVNAAAVKEFYKTPAIVIDFGTATTFDVVDKKGRYAGGVIAPGINLSIKALAQAAARLPRVSVKKPEKVVGKSTVVAMQSGVYWGYIGLIEGIVKKISAEQKEKFFVLATGGLAPLFADNTSVIKKVDDDLTLKGLLCIYRSLK
ncbi:MAG: type III pantothenate kinase [Alphaproteobacteria bacterium]|nr:type III pantothenate kinase [Alphaproteobacteria bacterium]